MSNYSKFKERKPQSTVYEIQRILREMDLFPVLSWSETSFGGAKACRLNLYPTSMGTNGKGTDELYCAASAYAELIERMNNGVLCLKDRSDPDIYGCGFREAPDERLVPVEELAEHPDPFMENVFSLFGLNDYAGRLGLLRMFSESYAQRDGTLPVIPFADPLNGCIQWLPPIIVHQIVGPNGMAAGNTLEEAMVQGLSEVFERAASNILIREKAVPPEIPEEEIREFGFYQFIEKIHADKRYRVRLYDCSLGRGWPVVGLGIFDVEKGSFGFKLGAHPSFAVAVERALTEALQGQSLEDFTALGSAGSDAQASHYHNTANAATLGKGYYPFSMFTEEPGWEYKPWTQWDGLGNRGFLSRMLQILKNEGFKPLIRDSSFLGYPSCFVIVPGLSEIFTPGKLLYHSLNSTWKLLNSFRHFPQLSEEEEDRFLKIIQFKLGSALENQASVMLEKPLSAEFDLERIAAAIAIKRGDFALAQKFINILVSKEQDADEQVYLRALTKYASARKNGVDNEAAHRLIRTLYREDAAERVCRETEDASLIMERMFPKLSCFDCENCEAAGSSCKYLDVRTVLNKISGSMKAENVNQDALLWYLEGLYSKAAKESE